MTLTCYSLDADETELASIEIQEVYMLSEKYWKVVVSLHNMVEASTEVYQRESPVGNRYNLRWTGRKKASGFNEVSCWFEGHDGQDAL
jgi:ligand-binding SRPBCC domain-containing protein